MEHLSPEQIWNLKENELHEEEKHKVLSHLGQCVTCKAQLDLIIGLEGEIRDLTVPDVAEGFALRVVAKVRESEVNRIFYQIPFKIFRITLGTSVLMLFIGVLWLLQDKVLNIDFALLPVNWFYYAMAAGCLVMIFLVDRYLFTIKRQEM